MEKSNNWLYDVVMILIGAAILAWLGVLLAPYMTSGAGLIGLMDGLNEAFAHPF